MGNILPFAVPYEALVEYEEHTTPDEDPIHDLVARDLDRERVRQLVRKLPDGESTAVWLRFGFDGNERTAAQVAETMRIGNSTARRLVRRGLDRIAGDAHDLDPAA